MIEMEIDDVSNMVIDFEVDSRVFGLSSPGNPYLKKFGHISYGYNPMIQGYA